MFSRLTALDRNRQNVGMPLAENREPRPHVPSPCLWGQLGRRGLRPVSSAWSTSFSSRAPSAKFGLGGKVGSVSVEDVEVARRWREVLDTDDPEARAALLAPDVEWVVVSGKTLRGIDEVRKYYAGSGSGGPENLDVEFDPGELEDLGDGRVSAVNHQVYRSKETGELAYERRARIEYTIGDGKIVRYEAKLLEE